MAPKDLPNKSSEEKTISDFSMLDPAVQADPFEFYQKLHQECPVYRMPETGMYMVTGFEDLTHVLKTPKDFSSCVQTGGLQDESGNLHQNILGERGWKHVQTLQRTDPPEHTRYRKLLYRVFTGKRVKDLSPGIVTLCDSLIDGFIERYLSPEPLSRNK